MGDMSLHGINFALITNTFSVGAKAQATVMSLFRKLFVIFTSLFTVLPHGAQAELQLETWKVYGQLAEQSAICANFSKLMESQSILNPDLGALWKERRKFAGAVIQKAIFMELNRESSEAEIDNLIASYRDWVLSSLMIDHKNIDVPKKTETNGRKIFALINNQCKNLFQQGDEMIRNQRPDLAYLLQNNSETQVKTKNSPSEETSTPKVKPQHSVSRKNPVDKTDQTVNQKPSSTGKALKLSIGGGNDLVLNLPGQKPSSSIQEPFRALSKNAEIKTKNLNGSLPTKLLKISGPVPRPDQGRIKDLPQSSVVKTLISAGTATSAASPEFIPRNTGELNKQENQKVKLSIERLSELLDKQAEANMNLIVPAQSVNNQLEQKSGNYFAQLGAFAQLKNAKAEKKRLETKFSALFAKLPIHITEITGSGPRFYRIQTTGLSQKHIKTLCDMMWPHKIACLAKR
ncbi:MAG: SPOR domain-containing protein [Candidatus Puniceispirillaceae bacterium]